MDIMQLLALFFKVRKLYKTYKYLHISLNYSVFCSFSLRDENGNHVIDPKEYAHLTATIDNRFGEGSTYKIMVAFYSEDGRLNGFAYMSDI